jgi:hypothetical protein
MSDQPGSPFTGLDKALLRSTQKRQAETAPTDVAPAASDGQRPTVPKTTKSTRRAKPRPQAATEAASDPIAGLHQQLKTIGKEIYYIRITPQEKAEIEDVLHALKRRGLRTSANELGRIALNQLLADYDAYGEESTLVRVLARMRA